MEGGKEGVCANVRQRETESTRRLRGDASTKQVRRAEGPPAATDPCAERGKDMEEGSIEDRSDLGT